MSTLPPGQKVLNNYDIQQAILRKCDSASLSKAARAAKVLYEPCQRLLWEGFEPIGPFLPLRGGYQGPEDHIYFNYMTPDLEVIDSLLKEFPTQLPRWLSYVRDLSLATKTPLAVGDSVPESERPATEYACLSTHVHVWSGCRPHSVRIYNFDIGINAVLPGLCRDNLRALIIRDAEYGSDTVGILDVINVERCPNLKSLAVRSRAVYNNDFSIAEDKDGIDLAIMRLLERQPTLLQLQVYYEGKLTPRQHALEHFLACILNHPTLQGVSAYGYFMDGPMDDAVLLSLLPNKPRPLQHLSLQHQMRISAICQLPLSAMRAIDITLSDEYPDSAVWLRPLAVCHRLEHLSIMFRSTKSSSGINVSDIVQFARSTPQLKIFDVQGRGDADETPESVPLPAESFLQILSAWPRLRVLRIDYPFEDIPAAIFLPALAMCPLLTAVQMPCTAVGLVEEEEEEEGPQIFSLTALIMRVVADTPDRRASAALTGSERKEAVAKCARIIGQRFPTLQAIYSFNDSEFDIEITEQMSRRYFASDTATEDQKAAAKQATDKHASLTKHARALQRKDDEQHEQFAETIYRRVFG